MSENLVQPSQTQANCLLSGKLYCYGDNVDTDVIIPARYLNTTDPAELARHCMEDLDADFAATVKPGDFIVAGQNFGSGSSREHAPVAIKASGIALVIAASFSRIFFRNAINMGLPILECPEAAAGIRPGDNLKVNLTEGWIENLSQHTRYQAAPFPEFIRRLMAADGLVGYVRGKYSFGPAEEAKA
ncbi:MAG: 3-isopropylmalate dehydratase small subunit [Oscillospiraceae bacterium]|nr:3-isopropylmalate dehydratase small subunit [Oscillospiraceae bacterium]MDD4367929.1 3-isopropylmalate dehydratase small subunit [Oscillospiraceae bacterium]